MKRNVEQTEAELVSLREDLSERSAKSQQVESELAASSTQLRLFRIIAAFVSLLF